MSVNELVAFIQQNPSVLKRPIMIDEKRLVVGYDDEEIEGFVPQELRRIVDMSCQNCSDYQACGKVREA